MSAVTLSGLTKRFGDSVAVDDLHLDIADGEFVSLLGPSGCGKTTTLRLVAGFLQPDEGRILVNGEVISSPSSLLPPERRDMSMIFQSYAVWPHMTVAQNVAYGLKFRRVSGAEADKKVRQILGVVKLDHLAHRYPGELSGGQQQRVALARALVVEPKILLMDEPLSNLDANLREEMRFEIRRLHDEFRITSIYVTHDQSEAMVVADRICVMNQGRVEQMGKPEEIYERPETRFVSEFIGKTNLVSGQLEDGGRVRIGDNLSLRVTGSGRPKGAEKVWVSIRPHHFQLVGEQPEVERYTNLGFNSIAAELTRRIYFGDAIDYLVKVSGTDLSLRVVAPPFQKFELGQQVHVLVHPDQCVLVSER